LKHVYWDIASGDDSRTSTCDSVCATLRAETQRLAPGNVELIYLLHDVNQVTSEHLPEFFDAIAAAVRGTGHTPEFTAERMEAELIMRRKSRAGTDNPCPADSMA
jgi:hypothetical protein